MDEKPGLKFEMALDLDFEEPKEPEEGWTKPCSVADHEWEMEIEDGQISLSAKNPHTEEEIAKMEPHGMPVCRSPYWEREDLYLQGPIPVEVKHVDDSTPSTPAGPAEYGFYLEIKIK